MKTFLAVFTGSPAAMDKWNSLPEKERQERQASGVAAWYAWVDKHQKAIVDMGGPLGKTKRITTSGIADIRNNMAAYVVVQAESQEEAAKLFEAHPHFTIFPGDGVEVMERLPIPQA